MAKYEVLIGEKEPVIFHDKQAAYRFAAMDLFDVKENDSEKPGLQKILEDGVPVFDADVNDIEEILPIANLSDSDIDFIFKKANELNKNS